MRPIVSLTLFVALICAVISVPTAQAQLNFPFNEDAVALSAEEKTQMRDAMHTVLESGKPGTEKRWNNPTSKRTGVAKLLRSFERQGAKCGQVQHTLVTPQKTDKAMTYSLPFCKQSDGTWKIAY
jgi:surface antigen